MALRRFLLILLCTGTVGLAQVKRYPLDDRSAYLVAIGTEAPTTVVFPGAVTALDAANLAAKPEDNPPVLLAHSPGAAFFTVRALRPGAQAAVNVLFQGKAYALTFRGGEAVDRTVTFFFGSGAEDQKALRLTTVRSLNVLDRARNFADLAINYPGLAGQIARATPFNVTEGPGFRATIEEVLRFEAEDTLVLTVRIENPAKRVFRYRADRLGVHVVHEIFPAALTDATGEVPPLAAVRVRVAVTGAPDGSRGALSVSNTFTLEIAPAP